LRSSISNRYFRHLICFQNCFADALNQKPGNQLCKKGMETAVKAPQLYDRIQKQKQVNQTVKQAEHAYEQDNYDTAALVQWGKALIMLANFSTRQVACRHVRKAVENFERASKIEALRTDVNHETLWCLGNAYISQAAFGEARALHLKAKVRGCATWPTQAAEHHSVASWHS
jgi:hypothetical protein